MTREERRIGRIGCVRGMQELGTKLVDGLQNRALAAASMTRGIAALARDELQLVGFALRRKRSEPALKRSRAARFRRLGATSWTTMRTRA